MDVESCEQQTLVAPTLSALIRLVFTVHGPMEDLDAVSIWILICGFFNSCGNCVICEVCRTRKVFTETLANRDQGVRDR
ncbi:hypothetical protein BT96DRAFT_402905 [Gymnopus androsaceus JB14]|uniref:Uncharacterized protein n=1 Tax=Gymnopus androsaceus JB14 TaxID=1447944 RepID=A0A6A4GUF5_9AGAR|nr:hypothetical protein BT96DRAFT_402905 [Gymnopus androsaceus JB14]